MVLAVRVVGLAADGSNFDELIHTLDIAAKGVRLGGADRLGLKVGQVIEVRRKANKARFRVVWVGEPGTPRTGQAGLQAVEVAPNFWGLELPAHGEKEIAEIMLHPATAIG